MNGWRRWTNLTRLDAIGLLTTTADNIGAECCGRMVTHFFINGTVIHDDACFRQVINRFIHKNQG